MMEHTFHLAMGSGKLLVFTFFCLTTVLFGCILIVVILVEIPLGEASHCHEDTQSKG
jgi:hypothetical protein